MYNIPQDSLSQPGERDLLGKCAVNTTISRRKGITENLYFYDRAADHLMSKGIAESASSQINIPQEYGCQ